jgi:hypothetical protein
VDSQGDGELDVGGAAGARDEDQALVSTSLGKDLLQVGAQGLAALRQLAHTCRPACKEALGGLLYGSGDVGWHVVRVAAEVDVAGVRWRAAAVVRRRCLEAWAGYRSGAPFCCELGRGGRSPSPRGTSAKDGGEAPVGGVS